MFPLVIKLPQEQLPHMFDHRCQAGKNAITKFKAAIK